MSLINQMLKDLEARRSQPGAALQPEVLVDVHAVSAEQRRGRRPVIIILSALLLLLLGGFGWWGYHFPVTPVVVEVPVVVESPKTKNDGDYASRLSPDPENPDESRVSPVPLVSQVVTRSVSQPEFKPQPQPEPEPESEPASPIPPPVVVPPEVAPVAAVVAVTKIDRPLHPREQAAAAFQRALLAQRAGESATMETALRQALQQDPSHLLARKTLARILVDQGAPAEAALVLLQGERPPVAQDTDFYQLLAAIYQRTGQFTAAAQIYRQLLGVQRQSGVWWLGLGLALESDRLWPEAKEAYRTALEDLALQAGLGDFARSRLTALGSAQL